MRVRGCGEMLLVIDSASRCGTAGARRQPGPKPSVGSFAASRGGMSRGGDHPGAFPTTPAARSVSMRRAVSRKRMSTERTRS